MGRRKILDPNGIHNIRTQNLLPLIQEQGQHLDVPSNIMILMRSYFEDREITYTLANAKATEQMSKGFPQGSVLSPVL